MDKYDEAICEIAISVSKCTDAETGKLMVASMDKLIEAKKVDKAVSIIDYITKLLITYEPVITKLGSSIAEIINCYKSAKAKDEI
jgi:hypothetical protein